MATDWEKDYTYLAKALPTPTDTPYRTPSASMSRHSLHRRDSSPGPSTSPPRFDSDARGGALDIANDESISPLDPRRFTPTLHASLVSEILSLRRDLEGKTRAIDSLEIGLENAKGEAESLSETLSKNSKENRSLKRQLQLLEGGSLSAMTELSKERDEALENISDFRKRVEQSQKRARTQEEEMERTQMLWERDKQNWEEERRNWERKVHVVEGRLKVVLNEVAAAQAANHFPRGTGGDYDDSSRDGTTTRGSDSNSVRSNSVKGRRRTSTASVSTHDGEPNHLRYSVMSLANGHGPKVDGLNLADELAFDEEEEDYRPDSRCTLPDERPMSMQSRPMSMAARRTMDFSVDGHQRFGTPDGFERATNLQAIQDLEDDEKTTTAPTFEYRDVGIQYTPPPSPQIIPEPDDTPISAIEDAAPPSSDKHDANQGRKRVSASRDSSVYQTTDSSTITPTVQTVSSACQTIGELPSPPWTPHVEEIPKTASTPTPTPVVETNSASTQTDDVIIKDKTTQELEEAVRVPVSIPVIAIHAPASNPPSARNSVVLPPQTKNVSCQTDIQPIVDSRSCGMQTEEIRVDKRPIKLPSSLLPSAIIDHPGSPESTGLPSPPPIHPYRVPPPRSARRKLRDPPPVEAQPPQPQPQPQPPKAPKGKEPEKLQAYPGNNDNGPLDDAKPELRRPFRTSSLFAGFEHISDDEWPEPSEELFSDDDIFNRPLASYTLRSGKMVSKPAPSILDDNPLEEREEHNEDDEQHSPKSGVDLHNGIMQRTVATGKAAAAKRPPRPLKLGTVAKQPDIRRTAMISSSTAAHQSYRPRSPSAPSIGSSAASTSTTTKPPPFPVPIRLSSRKIPTSASEGAQSPTPYSNGNYPDRMGRSREPPLRKSRSAAVVSRMPHPDRQQSHSPPAMSTSSAGGPESPQLPPMPFDEITAPHSKRQGNMHSGRQTSRPPPPRSHKREASTATTSVQQTSVVDAIAQTMVGEWMWKYVRRRRSFGMTENTKEGWELGKSTEEVSANITGNGVRHKRWVWLAPYERAVMWSSKQPTSGHALLGKSGRKLTIQSVLDVKDDNPLPKGSSPNNQFNRSILILTPQRALKFTALTVERHFVWLTALSFLSHSSMGVSDLASLPPVPQEEYTPPAPNATLRRNPIRDSIRVAKGKTRPPGTSSTRPTAVPELPYDEADPNSPPADNDAADPPNVPRFSSHSHSHTRKRSNTAPRVPPPPSAFRSFSNHTAAPSTYSTTTAGSSDLYSPSTMGGGPPSGIQSGQSSFSHRTSEASGPSSVGMSNFFEAVGTVRMEAFVDRSEREREHHGNGRRGGGGGHGYGYGQRTRHGGRGRRRDASYWPPNSPETEFAGSEDGGDVFFRNEDPFRGF
ncbi:hypothetical protein FQN53_006745 [Emmonsiellopsis sp. PD_33]|nr:hypothetical protein FQN53_006745 [Emmonsiellopsis sp. PD_33]